MIIVSYEDVLKACYKTIVLILIILSFILAYKDENLKNVKDAWIYKNSVALVMTRGILFFVEWLHLW